MSIATHSAGRRIKLYGALAIFIGLIIFFFGVAIPINFLITSGILLFIGGFITFLVGRFMD
mgnify:CR=1 FL=1